MFLILLGGSTLSSGLFLSSVLLWVKVTVPVPVMWQHKYCFPVIDDVVVNDPTDVFNWPIKSNDITPFVFQSQR